MKKQNKVIIVVLLIVVIALMYFSKNNLNSNNKFPEPREIDKVSALSSEVKSKLLNGEKLDKPVFLEFGSSGWPGCVRMESVMIELYEKYSDKIDVAYIGLDSRDSTMNFDLAKKYKIMAFPSLVLFDTDGKIFYGEVGIKSLDEIEEILKSLEESLVK